MKKVNMFLGLLAAAAIVFACAKEENPGTNDGTQDDTQKEEVTPGEDDEDQTGGEAGENTMAWFFATTESADVKVSIDQSGATALEVGDVAVVYVPATGASCNYVYSASEGRFAAAEGSTAVTLDGNEAWVCYPADYFTVSQEAGVALSIPESVATSGGYKSPMAGKLVSGTEGQEVELKNIGSILRVNLTSAFPQAPETVTAVRLNSDAGICAAALSFENELPALSEVSGGTSVTVELGEAGLVLSETANAVHFFIPAEVEASLSVDVCYGKAGWEAAPYTRVERNSALKAVRAELYDIDFAAGLFSGGDGSEANPYLIASAADFKALATAVNTKDAPQYGATTAGTFFGSAGAHYQQTADIDFADGESKGDLSSHMVGSSSAPFKGSYNGKNGETQHTISNFSITGTTYVGLFADCESAVISNVKVAGASVIGTQYVGAIFGLVNKGTVSGCETSEDCHVEGPSGNTGGISGRCNGGARFEDCVNRASVSIGSGTATNIGGIVGYTDNGVYEGCSNFGTVTGSAQAGGIVGRLNSGSITDCHNSGNISGSGQYIGGIAGELTAGSIVSCTNKGTISTENSYVGGIVGAIGQNNSGSKVFIRGCISEGTISGINSVAGIAGAVRIGAVYECCAKGTVTGTQYVGGLVGYIEPNKGRVLIFDSLVKSSVSGVKNSGGVIGLIKGWRKDTKSDYVYVTVTNCVGANIGMTTSSSAPATDQVGSFIGHMSGGSTYIRVAINYTTVQTELDFIGKYGAGNLKFNYYVYGPATTSASGNNVVDVLKEELADITPELMNKNKFSEQTLTPSSFKITPSSWTTVEGVAYPLPSGLVNQGEKYYK